MEKRITSLESKEVADLIGNVHFEVYSKSSMYPFEEEQEKFIHDVTPFIKTYASTLNNIIYQNEWIIKRNIL